MTSKFLADPQRRYQDRDFVGCLRDISALFLDEKVPISEKRLHWNEYLLGPKQLLLQAVRQASQSKDAETVDAAQSAIKKLFIGEHDLFNPPGPVKLLITPGPEKLSLFSFKKLFVAQLKVADIFLNTSLDSKAISDQLGSAIDTLTEAWGLNEYNAANPFGLSLATSGPEIQSDAAHQPERDRFPACWNRISTKWQTVLQQLGNGPDNGWSHPAFLAVVQWVAWILSDNDTLLPQADHTVLARIALAGSNGDGSLLGVLGQLTVERISGGRGLVYPDPLLSGGLLCDPSFSASIQRAIQVALADELAAATYDFRWSLTIDNPQGKQVFTHVSGRSGDVAIAAALRAAARGEQLDGHVVATAQFADTTSHNPTLEKVDEIVAKVLGLRETLRHQAQAKHVDTLVVSPKQPEYADPTLHTRAGADVQDGKIRLESAVDFDAAYEQLALFMRLTAQVKAKLHERSGVLLDKLCNPYLRNPLAVLVRKRSNESGQPVVVETEKRLTKTKVQEIERGDLSSFGNRIYLEADSGFGKSTFLLHLEHELSRPNSGPLLPLRFGAGPKFWDEFKQEPILLPSLSSVTWSGNCDAVLQGELGKATLLKFLPARTPQGVPQKWLEWCQRRNYLVYLFDAIDQTKSDMDKLGLFLETVPDAATLLTGRPRSQETHDGLFAATAWRRVLLKGLNVKQVQKYLGKKRVDPHADWFDDWDAPDHLWRPILEVPVVLRMIRELPLNETANLKNREHVYSKTVEQLLIQGKRSFRNTALSEDEKRKNFRNTLEIIAWHTQFPNGDDAEPEFTAELTGTAYNNALKRAEISHQALGQMNFITERSWLRGVNEYGVVWRHRSFCEYFAALYFLRLDRAERQRILKQHGRHAELGWLFCFALCAAERMQQTDLLAELAQDLIRYGRTMTVWNTIKHDQLKLPQPWDQLCRWLVHRDWDGRDALSQDKTPPKVDESLLGVLAGVIAPEYRDSRFLHPAWELLSNSSLSQAEEIRAKFLNEFADLVAHEQQRKQYEKGIDRQKSPVLQLLPEDELNRLDELDHTDCWRLVTERNDWRSCPPDPKQDKRTFMRGADKQSDPRADKYEGPRREIELTPFLIQSGLVTNAQYELFDPSHKKFRDRYSQEEDQPVHRVSWYMAQMYTIWLTGSAATATSVYRLPTEAEWEYACRAGTVTPYAIGDGQQLTEADANFDSTVGKTTPAGVKYPANAWGIYGERPVVS